MKKIICIGVLAGLLTVTAGYAQTGSAKDKDVSTPAGVKSAPVKKAGKTIRLKGYKKIPAASPSPVSKA